LSVLAGLVLPLVGWTPTDAESGTAMVRIVDHYDHGRVRITFDNVDRTMSEGDRSGPLTVTPDSMGNDVITVRALRYDKCGISKIGWYFHVGHEYRLRINHFYGGRCRNGHGGTVRGPAPHVDKLD
jgi:hypothetical protein